MTLNGIIALILCYFTEFDSFGGRLRHSSWRQTYNVRKISPSSSIRSKRPAQQSHGLFAAANILVMSLLHHISMSTIHLRAEWVVVTDFLPSPASVLSLVVGHRWLWHSVDVCKQPQLSLAHIMSNTSIMSGTLSRSCRPRVTSTACLVVTSSCTLHVMDQRQCYSLQDEPEVSSPPSATDSTIRHARLALVVSRCHHAAPSLKSLRTAERTYRAELNGSRITRIW